MVGFSLVLHGDDVEQGRQHRERSAWNAVCGDGDTGAQLLVGAMNASIESALTRQTPEVPRFRYSVAFQYYDAVQ